MTRKTNGSIPQLLKYVVGYSTRADKPEKEATILLKQNLIGKDMRSYIESFKENESLRRHRRPDNVILHHAVISFSPADYGKVTNAILRNVSKKWIELIAPNCLALGVGHTKENRHAHIVYSGVTTHGKSSRVSKQFFAEALKRMEEYQVEHFPQLSYSAISHGRKRSPSKEFPSRESSKEMLKTALRNFLLRPPNAITFEPYFRNEKIQGVIHGDKKYRLTTLGLSSEEIFALEQYFKKLKEIRYARTKTRALENEFSRIRIRTRGLGEHQALGRG